MATSEVAAAIMAFPGIAEASVYGVPFRGTEGAAGMATLVADGELILRNCADIYACACRLMPGHCSCGSKTAST